MADMIPVKAIYTSTDVTALGEFAPTDTISLSLISGFSAGVTLELGNNSVGALGDVDVPAPANNEVLVFNSTSGNWEAAVSPGSSAAIWGNITGTLSNQLDLQAALDLKADQSSLDAHTGDATIHFSVLNGLSDVNVPAPSDGEILTWNNAALQWEAQSNIHTVDELVKVSVTDTTAGYLGTELTAGSGITLNIQNPAADEKLQVVADVYLTTIGGNTMAVFLDASRANKELSIETQNYLWAEAAISNNDWIQIQHATDAQSGYIMPFNATIISIAMQCENTNNNTKDIRLYVNNTNQGSIGQFTGSGEQTYANTTLNIDVTAGDKLRLRGAPGQGTIQDTNIQLRIKWRV